MRWGYLIPRLIIVALIWAFMTYGLDPLLRRGAVNGLQAATGAKADIGNIETAFFPQAATVKSVALADRNKPGRNLVEFDVMTLKFAGDALLRRSYVVDEATITGIELGTFRDDDGQLEREEDDDESSGPIVPPWLQDKLKNIGDEWVDQLTDQARQQLDPNLLESYRVGNEVYLKWEDRFATVEGQIKQAETELKSLEAQIKAAKNGDTLQQVEQYLRVAQRADLLSRNLRVLIDGFRTSVPQDVKRDFARLNQAQLNDRAKVGDTIRMLRPDSGQVTESLLGEEMYGQLQDLLSWLNVVQGYQDQIRRPEAPARARGRDFEFELFNPTPKFLAKRIQLSGMLSVNDTPTPFDAIISNVTSDPKLLGQPAVLNGNTTGALPVQLLVTHNATVDVPITTVAAEFVDNSERSLSAGRADKHQFTASLGQFHWTANVVMTNGTVDGKVRVRSNFGSPQFRSSNKHAALLTGLTEQSLGAIQTVNTELTVTGSVKKPQVQMSSDLGSQFSASFDRAFAAFVPEVKSHLLAEVDSFVAKEKDVLSKKLGGHYSEIMKDHQTLLDQLASARKIATDLRSGKLDARQAVQFASDAKLLKGKDQQKANEILKDSDEVLRGLSNPNKAFENALPGLRNKLFDKLNRL